jgi:hypothetical protein
MFIRLIIVIAFIITAGLAIPGFANPDVKHKPETPLSAYSTPTNVTEYPKSIEEVNQNVTPVMSGQESVHQ